jgi:hypothetical protein
MAVYQIHEVRHASDVEKIEQLMQGIISEVCWGIHLSYGNELKLEIGARLPYRVLKGKERGEWSLGARASQWFFYLSNEPLVTSRDSIELFKQKTPLMEGNPITAFSVEYPELGLEITFSNEMRLKISPSWDSSELAHWELLAPNSMFLQVGPEATWRYHPSDIPPSELKFKR